MCVEKQGGRGQGRGGQWHFSEDIYFGEYGFKNLVNISYTQKQINEICKDEGASIFDYKHNKWTQLYFK